MRRYVCVIACATYATSLRVRAVLVSDGATGARATTLGNVAAELVRLARTHTRQRHCAQAATRAIDAVLGTNARVTSRADTSGGVLAASAADAAPLTTIRRRWFEQCALALFAAGEIDVRVWRRLSPTIADSDTWRGGVDVARVVRSAETRA
jgi:hypothetical protein